jgi:hypothetical protein
MLANLFDMLFGCWHKNYTFPITANTRDRYGAHGKTTYVVCLDCGKEFPYDWEQMKVISSEPAHATALPIAATAAHLHKAA